MRRRTERTVGIVTPAARGSLRGNRVTALRYARLFRALGHEVRLLTEWRSEPVDLLIAIHAVRSAPSIDRWRRGRPRAPLVVVLSGTDVYGRNRTRSLEAATRIVALQPRAIDAIPARFRKKARPILQSAPAPRRPGRRPPFVAVVAGHLRAEKDPLLPAAAARLLPARSRVRIEHLGAALDPAWERRAAAESRSNRRWRWRGAVPRAEAMRRIARAWLLLLPSRLEGGANVLMEAIAAGTPVLASRVPGNTGILGEGYPGLFRAGDARPLARLLRRCEKEPDFRASLGRWIRELRPLAEPRREREAWGRLFEEIP